MSKALLIYVVASGVCSVFWVVYCLYVGVKGGSRKRGP